MDQHGRIGNRWLLSVSALIFAVAAVVLAFAMYDRIASAPPWAPLGRAPTQEVLNPGNRILTSGLVQVKATKCYNEAVTSRGSISWVSVEPPGTIIETAGGVAPHAQGCITRVYQNPIPKSVVEVVEAGGPTVWRITGTETPTNGRREGVTRVWSTEPFTLVRSR